jgi:hypothetical protein
VTSAVVVVLLVVIHAIVRALRCTGQLTGEPAQDRRRVLSLLGSLPLAALVGDAPPALRKLPLRELIAQSPQLQDLVSRVISQTFDGLFSRADLDPGRLSP